jgi:hypothetical protein
MIKITIDEGLLEKMNLSLGEYLLLFSLNCADIDEIKLEENKLIKITDKGLVLRTKGKNFIQGHALEHIDSDINVLVEEYRKLFKATGKRGAMGDKRALKEKLTKFLIAYPQYDYDLILKAISSYIETEAEQGYKYLQQAHYTVSKKAPDGTDISRLAVFCEEELDNPTSDDNFSEIL